MILRRFEIRAFSGRIIGLAIGFLAGPAGALFGLLVGWMVDQYRSSGVSVLRIRRFLADPRRERAVARRVTYGIAAIAAELLAAGSWPGEETVEYLLDQRWPRGRTTRRTERAFVRRADRAAQRRAFELCLIERHHIDLSRTLPPVAESLPDGEGRRLLDLLVRTLSVRGVGITTEERRILFEVAQTFGVALPELARMEEIHGSLSSRECEILGVGRDADRAAIKHSYRALVAQIHPDTGSGLDGDQREMMEGAFLRIHEAYEALLRQLDERDLSRIP